MNALKAGLRNASHASGFSCCNSKVSSFPSSEIPTARLRPIPTNATYETIMSSPHVAFLNGDHIVGAIPDDAIFNVEMAVIQHGLWHHLDQDPTERDQMDPKLRRKEEQRVNAIIGRVIDQWPRQDQTSIWATVRMSPMRSSRIQDSFVMNGTHPLAVLNLILQHRAAAIRAIECLPPPLPRLPPPMPPISRSQDQFHPWASPQPTPRGSASPTKPVFESGGQQTGWFQSAPGMVSCVVLGRYVDP